jgi:hypothetical protein
MIGTVRQSIVPFDSCDSCGSVRKAMYVGWCWDWRKVSRRSLEPISKVRDHVTTYMYLFTDLLLTTPQ